MKRLRDFYCLYVIYRQVNSPFKAARYAWIVSGG